MAHTHHHEDPFARGSAGFAAAPPQTTLERWTTLLVAAGLIFGLAVFPVTCTSTTPADAETSAGQSD